MMLIIKPKEKVIKNMDFSLFFVNKSKIYIINDCIDKVTKINLSKKTKKKAPNLFIFVTYSITITYINNS